MNKTLSTLLILLTLTLSTSCGARKTTPKPNPLTTDPGVTINGITWATRNVDAPGTFAANPEDAGMLFQWNRRKGWNAVDEFVESWDNSYSTGTEWYAENDPCPQGWRVPTEIELDLLIGAGHIWTTLNDINGRTFGTYPNQIFLPVAGWRSGGSGVLKNGTWGNYQSSAQGGIFSARVWGLGFSRISVTVGTFQLADGLSIRCVKIK